MEHLSNGQIMGFLFFLVICIVLAIVGSLKQKRPPVPYNDWIREVIDTCNQYGVSVRTFGEEANSERLVAFYHQGHTPIEAIQEFRKETINEQEVAD